MEMEGGNVGEIKKLLAAEKIPYRTITNRKLWGDLCENIHLHFRNLRLDFSHREWAQFCMGVQSIGMNVEREIERTNHREGDPNFLLQIAFNEPLTPDSKYYPNRATIELQRDNTVHLHYRDLRIHLSNEEFRQLAEMFTKGLYEMDNIEEFPYKEAGRYMVPIHLIQPHDPGHLPLAEDKEHRRGIEYVKLLIQTGKKIRPILVNPEGQRLDGFKRYMAFKELGYDEIEVIVDPYGKMGGQHELSFEDDELHELQGSTAG